MIMAVPADVAVKQRDPSDVTGAVVTGVRAWSETWSCSTDARG